MNKVIHYLGLDVHKETIAVSIAPANSTEVRRYGIIGGTLDAADKLVKKLARDNVELRLVYEAGPCGFVLCRHLRNKGFHCEVVAPSLIPKKATDRVKTDRRDADQLARLYRAGELTAIHVPDQEDEAVRDLVRARTSAVTEPCSAPPSAEWSLCDASCSMCCPRAFSACATTAGAGRRPGASRNAS